MQARQEMPFVQPMGVSMGSRPNNVKSIINSFNNPTPKPKPEAEKSCQVKNNWASSADDSIHIFTKTWQPIGVSVHSVVVFVHDIVEHCERYQPLFVLFAGKGIEVQSFDLPGFGETGARANALGVTGGYDALLKEIDNALDRALTTRPSKPIFLMGHGMGGALVLNYVCGLGQRVTSLAGIMVSSPYLKPAIRGAGTRFPSTYNRLGKWYPNINVSFQVLPQELTRDHAEQERHHGDGLIRDSVSLRCLGDMIYQGQKILKKRWKQFPPALPTLLLHGTDDPICSYQATATLNTILQKLELTNLKFKSWKGNRHDPHWDLDADAVRSEYIHWIRNISRNYVKPPVEPEMVHSDSLKSAKTTASNILRGKRAAGEDGTTTTATAQQKDSSPPNSKGKSSVKDKRPSTNDSEPDVATTLSGASAAEPEAIQDLAGLRRQQELKLQRAMEKRQEYNLLSNEKSAAADGKAVSGDTAASEAPVPEAISGTDQKNSLTSSSPSLPADTDDGAKTDATEESSTMVTSDSDPTSKDDAAAAANDLRTTANAASAANLADPAAASTLDSESENVAAAAATDLTTTTGVDHTLLAADPADTAVSALMDAIAAEMAPASRETAIEPDSSAITAVTIDTLDPSVTVATEEACVNNTDKKTDTQAVRSVTEQHTETEAPSVSDLNAVAVPVATSTVVPTAAPTTDSTAATTTTDSSATFTVDSAAATTAHATAAENTNIHVS
ncbi:hypothetical protein BGZ72_003206 [Mortierella alpina]|nr:hypothetical protein BGZ72_003206 [Mortierella alpina]